MALITCADCAARISDLAPACPHCGRPADAAHAAVQPIELTAKTWKAMRLGGWAMALAGAIAAAALRDVWPPWGMIAGVVLCGFGLLTVMDAAFGRWWHHG